MQNHPVYCGNLGHISMRACMCVCVCKREINGSSHTTCLKFCKFVIRSDLYINCNDLLITLKLSWKNSLEYSSLKRPKKFVSLKGKITFYHFSFSSPKIRKKIFSLLSSFIKVKLLLFVQ